MKPGRTQSKQAISSHPVLSIKQPWAALILDGRKDVEVRSWATSYRGPLWIHTGQKLDTQSNQRFELPDLFRGGIVGSVVLWGIRPFSVESWKAWHGRHLDNSPFNEELGKYGWIFRDPRSLSRPLPAKGTIRLFHLSDALEKQARQRLKDSR
jgi:ASCH domain